MAKETTESRLVKVAIGVMPPISPLISVVPELLSTRSLLLLIVPFNTMLPAPDEIVRSASSAVAEWTVTKPLATADVMIVVPDTVSASPIHSDYAMPSNAHNPQVDAP